MSRTSSVLCLSDCFPFYSFFCCIFCYETNQICSMISLKNLGLTPNPLVSTLFELFLCVFTILLVVLLFGGPQFFHKQKSSSQVIFMGLNFSYQQNLSPKVVNSLKCFGVKITSFLSKFETQFYSYSRRQTLLHSLQTL